MKIIFAGSELSPFSKTGGLADVMGTLPRVVAELGHDCAVISPLYNCVRPHLTNDTILDREVRIVVGLKTFLGRIHRTELPGSSVPVYFVEQDELFGRDDSSPRNGLYSYLTESGEHQDYEDNLIRFTFFCRAVLATIRRMDGPPDIVHCNDWQTSLVPIYLKTLVARDPLFAKARSLQTIHNLAYQGVFWHWDMPLTGLSWDLFNWRQLEFHGKLNLLKGGIVFADRLNTVSPTYVQEIQTRAHGCGLQDVLQHHQNKLTGIVNGVDYTVWNPATDKYLAHKYDASNFRKGKAQCKTALQKELGLPVRAKPPVLAVISRLVEQKGFMLIHDIAKQILEQDVQLVVLGQGDRNYQIFLENMQRHYPNKVAVCFEFNEGLAHRIEAGADIFLMPSRFEPSGLNQLYSLKYGTVPIVRKTGGLADTIRAFGESPKPTGFVFEKYEPTALLHTVREALSLFKSSPQEWNQLVQNGMGDDWSWKHSAKEYVQLYEELAPSDE